MITRCAYANLYINGIVSPKEFLVNHASLLSSAVLAGCLVALGLADVATVSADPRDYPEFAQQRVAEDISVRFTSVDELKTHIDSGDALKIVDVRGYGDYARGHLPGAISVPLGVLPYALEDIPRDIPVVLY